MKTFLFLLVFFLTFSFLNFFGEIYLSPEKSFQEVDFSIKKGEKIGKIAERLERKGLIKDRWNFIFYILLSGKRIQAGKYLISSSETLFQIAEKFHQGKIAVLKIKILEGWNLEEIASYLEEKKIAPKEEFFKIVGRPKSLSSNPKDFSEKFKILKEKPKGVSLEGYLFPDTYLIKKDQPLENLVAKMIGNLEKKIDLQLQKEIKRKKRTIHQILTMASLLEKEVKTLKDRKKVAGILWKRLSKGMPLQVDATITYLTGKKTIKISKKELEINSPYNTYLYLGLPPGPISSPSFESILAAIFPQETEFLYYLALPEKTIYSKTFKEHILAKRRYLK